MAIDDEELVIAVGELAKDGATDLESARDVIVKSLAAKSFPIVGDVILGVVNGLAQERWNRRIVQLLKMFADYLTNPADRPLRREYFDSEEFQALLIEAIDQQRVERFEEKRKMLALGLANSGTEPFVKSSNKETFFRIMRELTPTNIHMLARLGEPAHKRMQWGTSGYTKITISQEKGEPSLYRLQGLGLVTSVLQITPPNLNGIGAIRTQGGFNRVVASTFGAQPMSIFSITQFGLKFLEFLTERDLAAGLGGDATMTGFTE